MNDIDVNILIQNYHSKISTLYNQNILLESKLQSLSQDFLKEKESLILKNLELQKEVDKFSRKPQKKSSPDNFIESEVE